MAIPLDLKQVVSFEELLVSQVVQQEALTRLLVERTPHFVVKKGGLSG